jgi:hypothetical protein
MFMPGEHMKLSHFATWTTALVQGTTTDTDNPPTTVMALSGFPPKSKFLQKSVQPEQVPVAAVASSVPMPSLCTAKPGSAPPPAIPKTLLKYVFEEQRKIISVPVNQTLAQFSQITLATDDRLLCFAAGSNNDSFELDSSMTFEEVGELLRGSFLNVKHRTASVTFVVNSMETYRNFPISFLQQANVHDVLQQASLQNCVMNDNDFELDPSVLFAEAVDITESITVNLVHR